MIRVNGKAKQYASGAQRDSDEGRGHYECLPACAVRRVAIRFEQGARHYGTFNWQKGIPWSRLVRSTLRHTFDYLGGDRSEDHPAAIICNAMMLIYHEEFLPELNDIPARRKK